jgi:hypothetical protein
MSLGTVSERMVESFRDQETSRRTRLSLPENIISKLENTFRYSRRVQKSALLDASLTQRGPEFAVGIPGLYWSVPLAARNDVVAHRTMSEALVPLPGPTSVYASLSWGIIHLV